MSRISILKRSIRTAVAALNFIGLLSPAHAAYQHDAVAVFPNPPISATADHAVVEAAVTRSRSMVLPSHLPWPAPCWSWGARSRAARTRIG